MECVAQNANTAIHKSKFKNPNSDYMQQGLKPLGISRSSPH